MEQTDRQTHGHHCIMTTPMGAEAYQLPNLSLAELNHTKQRIQHHQNTTAVKCIIYIYIYNSMHAIG